MSAFTFRLEPLLLLRRAERDARRYELGQALDDWAQLLRAKETIQQQITHLLTGTRTALASGLLNVAAIRERRQHEAALRAELATLQQQEQQATRNVECCRDALATAEREVQVLEKLRERQQQLHQQQHLRHETRHLDEVATRGHRQARA